MILGHVKCGQGQKALLRQMQQENVQLDSFTFVGVLNACASIGALESKRAGVLMQRSFKVVASLMSL
jgi:hypothetical protein